MVIFSFRTEKKCLTHPTVSYYFRNFNRRFKKSLSGTRKKMSFLQIGSAEFYA